jgi:hypothetical protein
MDGVGHIEVSSDQGIGALCRVMLDMQFLLLR